MTGRILGWMVLMVGLLTGAAALSQDSAPPADPPSSETQDHGDSSPAPEDAGLVDDNDEAAVEQPVIEGLSDPQDDPKATMERFRPTEKISEDRSVAFPNDI